MERKIKVPHVSELIDTTLKNKERVLARQLARELNRKELREVSGGACRKTEIPMLDVRCDVNW